MNKKIIPLAIALGGAALIGEIVVHGYLDVMYAERIPEGFIKRLGNKMAYGSMDEFYAYNREQNEWLKTKKVEKIDLKNEKNINLKGYFLPAEKESDVYVLFAHGYRSDHNGDPSNFVRYYHEKGFNFMSVDHVTAGESEGDFLGFDYFEAEDMLLWADYLINRFGNDIKIILHGVSMGGATVCKMASRVPQQVKMIISDCAYTSAEDEFINVAGGVGIKKTAPVILSVFNELNKRLAGFDLKETDVRESVKNSKVPMLFVHGGADEFVPTRMVYELYDLCEREKDILVVEGAAHAESIMRNGDIYKAKLDEFIEKHI